MDRPKFSFWIVVAVLAVVTACTVGPDYSRPETELPDTWFTKATAGLDNGTSTLQTWWLVFDDPQLDDLIKRSADGNLSLREALWRVEEARARRGIATSVQKPQVDFTGESNRSQPSENGLLSDFVPPEGFEASSVHDYGVSAFWEIDVFGRIRRITESANASVQASVESYRDVLVSLYSEVALAYVTVRTEQERMRLALANVDVQEDTLQLTRDRFDSGLVSALDVAQAESNLANTYALIPTIEQSLEKALNRLAVLLGETPGSVHDELGNDQMIPQEPDRVASLLPAELLRQRPDIRQAERLLASQTALIGVATADLYPTFSLSGFLGLQALEFGDLADDGSLTWGIGLPIRWNIFSGGRIRSQIRVEETRTEQLLANYERTVLFALEEVENAMIGYNKEVQRRSHLTEAVDANQRSLDLVMTQYTAGITNFQNVLDTQRSLLLKEDELAGVKGLVIGNLVRLYRALGGGWDPDLDEQPMVPAEDERIARAETTG